MSVTLQLIRQAVMLNEHALARKYATQFMRKNYDAANLTLSFTDYRYQPRSPLENLFRKKEWDVLAILPQPTQKIPLWDYNVLQEYFNKEKGNQNNNNELNNRHRDACFKFLQQFYDVSPVLGDLVEAGQTELALQFLTADNMFYFQPTHNANDYAFDACHSAIHAGVINAQWDFLDKASKLLTKKCDQSAELWYTVSLLIDDAQKDEIATKSAEYLQMFYTDDALVEVCLYEDGDDFVHQFISPRNLEVIWGDDVGTRVLEALADGRRGFLQAAAKAVKQGGRKKDASSLVLAAVSHEAGQEELVQEYFPQFFTLQ
eukprot:TRINITY_DN33844_c0_g1_i1.p2 TRINITY_DN33844_c0_g1~~TRINITY_DN33844_c0_g1_i1.p2  ORF type:complete len:317 (+),score=47.52 TRINITY_DN33844_c0_g1_i1:44-994(+)